MGARIAGESLPLVVPLAVAAVALPWVLPLWCSLVPLLLLAFTVWFFRDPDRRIPADPGAVLAPADGRVIRADSSHLSVFMNLFDVHVCRAPVGGIVASVSHRPGRFLAAFRDGASEHNERTEILLEVDGGAGRVWLVLVAGLIARRIVCRVAAGQHVGAGERVGLIRFGSRVDLELPAGASVAVGVGDRVVAGETVVASLGNRL
jgi:phosphatidylserine decarboxylase